MTRDMYWISDIIFMVMMLLIWGNNTVLIKLKSTEKSFFRLLVWSIIYCAVDAVWGICFAGIIRNDLIFFIASSFFHIATVLSTFFWLRYILEFLGDRVKHWKLYLTFDIAIIIFEAVIVLQNIFSNCLFSIQDGEYIVGPYRSITFINQNAVFVVVALLMLFFFLKKSGEERDTYKAAFVFTVSPVIFGLLQYKYPDAPFYGMAYFFGCFIIYIYIVAKESEKVLSDQSTNLDDITALNAELHDKQFRLEEAAAEQEAQLEEITALNDQLQVNQERLEELAAEQEAQIEEVSELNQTLEEYSEAMSNAGLGMWHIILKDGEIPRMQVNDKMAELLGIAGKNLNEEDTYSSWYDRILPEALPSVNASVAEMMEGKFSENTYLWNHPVNGDIYVRCGGTATCLPDGTNILSGYHADVTEIVIEDKRQREEIEQARREAEEERAKVSDAYGMIYGLSREYHTIWVVSKETSRMKLIRSSGVSTIQNAVQMGKDYPEFDAGFEKYINTYIEPEDRERMKKEIAFAEILRQLEKSDLYAVNYLRRDDSGKVGYHQIAFANADTEDGVKQFVYGFRDIDELVKEEQKQREELKAAKEAAEAADRAKTSFLFNMSHDIRTPMNAIIGFANLMKKSGDDKEKWPEYLDKIINASDFLLDLINNVLETARIESGKMSLNETVGSVTVFTNSLADVFEGTMKEKNLTYEKEINVEHEYVYVDSTKLKEIFLNIVSNAVKYTPDGGHITYSLKELPSEKEGYALFQTRISDTGIGMSEEYLPHVFEAFTREKTSTENKVQGTGLGMPIVKKLVDLMGGDITVESQVGVGTTFTVTLQHKISGEEEYKEEKKVDNNVITDLHGRRILLAEDNDLNAEIAGEILKETGVEVDRAADGLECLHMLEDKEANYYDLILMDIQMPNMDGYKATEEIRKMSDQAKANIPIIAMTANAFEEDRRNAIDAGMNGHLSKPIQVPKLMEALSGILQSNQVVKTEPKNKKITDTFDATESKLFLKLKMSHASNVAPGGFFAYRADQPEKLIYANELACSIWGCQSFNELYEHVNGSFKGMVHPDDYERSEREIWEQINKGNNGLDQVKYRIIKKDGTVTWIDDYGRLVRDKEDGDIFYVFVSESLDKSEK